MAESLTTLRRQCGMCKARLTHLETFLAGFRTSGEPLETLLTKIEFIQNTWIQFKRVQDRIEELDESDTERQDIEDRYCVLIGRARALAKSLEHLIGETFNNIENEIANHKVRVKLPTMNLPIFDGNPEK